MGCASDLGCTDPRSPRCEPHFTGTVCAACRGCGPTCASPDTPIATPTGERAIAQLTIGDLVLSVDHGSVRAVPITRLARNPVTHHVVVRIRFATGRTIEMSHGHPTADGRALGDLAPGDSIGDARIVAIETVPFRFDATYDVLPASDTGAYFASGVLVGSTLAAPLPH